jgi:hypothetical protein
MLSVLITALLFGLSAARAEPAAVTVEVKPSAPGAPPSIVVRATGGPVHVPGCRGVTWQSFDVESGNYAPIDEDACGPLQPAVRIDKDGTEFTLPSDPGSAQAVRAVVVVGVGCRADRPFPLADCTAVSVVEGAPAMLRKAPTE